MADDNTTINMSTVNINNWYMYHPKINMCTHCMVLKLYI